MTLLTRRPREGHSPDRKVGRDANWKSGGKNRARGVKVKLSGKNLDMRRSAIIFSPARPEDGAGTTHTKGGGGKMCSKFWRGKHSLRGTQGKCRLVGQRQKREPNETAIAGRAVEKKSAREGRKGIKIQSRDESKRNFYKSRR